jgi:hypothetical protein
MLEREELGSGTLEIAANAAVALWYRVERSGSRAGVSPAEVQRLSRCTVTPITPEKAPSPPVTAVGN